ncbi:MAG: TA system VapC family ribonuclease toxin [Opitutaceae bacterium]
MSGHLLDANVFIALAWPNHPHHARAHAWFRREQKRGWGTCLVTQLAFVRVSSNPAVPHHVSPQAAHRQLLQILALPQHFFVAEPRVGYADTAFARTLPNTLTHQLVTDAYLVTLAAIRRLKLATFDRQLAATFPEAALV